MFSKKSKPISLIVTTLLDVLQKLSNLVKIFSLIGLVRSIGCKPIPEYIMSNCFDKRSDFAQELIVVLAEIIFLTPAD